jgi:hypothetical protein
MALHSGGDILAVQKESEKPFSFDLAGDGSSRTTHAVAARTNFQVVVQKITIAVITHANSKAIVFQDTTGTPVKLWTFNDYTAAAGVPDVVTVDFGPHGYALPVDKGLDIVEPGSGTVCSIHVEGYSKQGAVLNLTTATNAS